jgi:lysophospholipase L1-like esterase
VARSWPTCHDAGVKHSTAAWLRGIVIGLGVALATAELMARLVLSVPAVSDRLSHGGPHARLIGQLERYGWRRRTGGWDYGRQLEPHARWGWVNTPGSFAFAFQGATITTNAQRMRAGRSYELVKPPGLTRIEVFGDSFAYGAEVGDAETFAARLEQEGDHLEVLNFGVPGYGLDQVYLRFQDDGRRYGPDIVIINLMHLLLTRCDTRSGTWYKPYFAHQGERLILHGVPVPSPEEAYRSFLYRPRLLDLYRLASDSEQMVGDDQALHELLLVQLGREIRAAGARAIVAIAPARRDLESRGVHSGLADLASAVCAREHLECLDVFLAFQQAAAAGTPLEVGVHWNAAGHEIVAQALLAFLRDHRSAPVP